MSSEEHYRRGLADASRDEPDPFFYQHYYHYRRGYDAGRRRQLLRNGVRLPRWWPLALGLLALLGFAGLALILWPTAPVRPVAAPTAAPIVIVATPVPLPTLTPLPTSAVATAPPTPELRVGGTARVTNIGEGGLRARSEPNVAAPVRTTLGNDEVVNVVEGPVEADGYQWWRIETPNGSGWSAAGPPGGAPWLTPEP